MSKGPGRVERRLREALTDPSRNRWTTKSLIAHVYDGLIYDKPTEAQRVSVGRALRKVLAGNDEWRFAVPSKGSGLPRHAICLIRERPAPSSDGNISI